MGGMAQPRVKFKLVLGAVALALEIASYAVAADWLEFVTFLLPLPACTTYLKSVLNLSQLKKKKEKRTEMP